MDHNIDYCIQFGIEFGKLVLLCCGLFNLRFRWKSFILYFLLGTVTVLTIMEFTTMEDKYIVGVFAFLMTLLTLDSKRKILICFFSYNFMCLFDMIWMTLLMSIFQMNSNLLETSYSLVFLGNLSCFIWIGAFVVVLRREKINLMSLVMNHNVYMLLLALLLIGFYLGPLVKVGFLNSSNIWNKMLVILGCISSVFFIFIATLLIKKAQEKEYFEKLSVMNGKLLDSQKRYYELLLKKEVETRKFRHDVSNHFNCMHYLFANQEYEQLEQYFVDVNKSLSDLKLRINTGNTLLSVILNDVVARNTDSVIDIRWNGQVPDHLLVSNFNLCTIFSNVLTNAVEAVNQVENGRFIFVSVKVFGGALVIQIDNAVKENVSIIDNVLDTTKKDKTQHGWGSKNVEKCIEYLQGSIKYSCEDKIFTTKIILPNVVEI